MKYYPAYHSFTSRRYRLCTFLLIPAVLILLQWIFLLFWQKSFHIIASGIVSYYFILADIWVFGGSCARREFGIEYLKASARGIPLLRKAMIGDCLVRFAVTTLILGVTAVMDWLYLGLYLGKTSAREIFLSALLAVFVSNGMSALFLAISRCFTHSWLVLMFASMEIVAIFDIPLFLGKGLPRILCALLTAAASVGFSALTVRATLQNIRRNYDD